MKLTKLGLSLAGVLLIPGSTLLAQGNSGGSAACQDLPTHAQLKAALKSARGQANGGFNLDMWATVVNRDGAVCAVAFTGNDRGDQWPGSRVISAQKANAANAFSLPKLALSTANLYSAVQPGGSLFGLPHTNPVNTTNAYAGDAAKYGQPDDPMVGERVGGVNVFGGGLALYTASRKLVGGLGVSGDSSCADHNIAWRTRNNLALDYVPAGVSGDTDRKDNIVYDISTLGANGGSAGGWGHPRCSSAATAIASGLPSTH
ncbi:MAG: heme-binding protein [Bryobacterales bacterium]|nr:heme-binding protein [Bryobacterales bacterium]